MWQVNRYNLYVYYRVKRETAALEIVLGYLVHQAHLDHQAGMAQSLTLVNLLDHLDLKEKQGKMALGK